jgi:hypothetical protein
VVYTAVIRLHGYVVVPPLNKWDEPNKQEIWGSLGYPSFGKTPVEAWKRYIHPSQYEHIDFSIIVQRCHDRGYRIKEAILEIQDE